MSKINPSVPIELDRPRNLRLDLNAMVAFEEASGKSMFKLKSMENLSVADLRALLWASLRHEDKDLTLEQVGGLVDLGNMEYIAGRLAEAWAVALPAQSEKKVRGKNP